MAFCTPLVLVCAGREHQCPNRWQPLIGPSELGSVTQKFVGAHWEKFTPFAQTSVDRFHDLEIAPRLPDIFKNASTYEHKR